MVRKVAADHRTQPLPLLGNAVVHALAQLDLDVLQPRSHAVAARFALELVGPAPRLAADEDEAQELEGLWLALPTACSPGRREAPKLQQPQKEGARSPLLPMGCGSDSSQVGGLTLTRADPRAPGLKTEDLTPEPRSEDLTPEPRFWPDILPYHQVQWHGVMGHRQVTEAYLAALARHHQGKLASVDKGLVALHPDVGVAVDA